MIILNNLSRNCRQNSVFSWGFPVCKLICLWWRREFRLLCGWFFLWGDFQVDVPVKAVKAVCQWSFTAPINNPSNYVHMFITHIFELCLWLFACVDPHQLWCCSTNRTCAVKCYEDVTMETVGPWERWPCMWACMWERGCMFRGTISSFLCYTILLHLLIHTYVDVTQ